MELAVRNLEMAFRNGLRNAVTVMMTSSWSVSTRKGLRGRGLPVTRYPLLSPQRGNRVNRKSPPRREGARGDGDTEKDGRRDSV